MTNKKVHEIINAGNIYSDDFAKAIYQIIEQARVVLGYKFTKETWEDMKQDVMVSLYKPTKNGPSTLESCDFSRNPYSYIRQSIYWTLKTRKNELKDYLDRYCGEMPTNKEGFPVELANPKDREWDMEDQKDFLRELLADLKDRDAKGEDVHLELERCKRLLNDIMEDEVALF